MHPPPSARSDSRRFLELQTMKADPRPLSQGDLEGRVDPDTSIFTIEQDAKGGRLIELSMEKGDEFPMPWKICFEEK